MFPALRKSQNPLLIILIVNKLAERCVHFSVVCVVAYQIYQFLYESFWVLHIVWGYIVIVEINWSIFRQITVDPNFDRSRLIYRDHGLCERKVAKDLEELLKTH